MINLLPDKAKRAIARERRLRLASVFLLALALATGALCLFLLPTSILLDTYQAGDGIGQSAQTLVNERLAKTEKELATTKTVIDHLSKDSDARDYSSLIADLDELGGDSIRLQQFVFDEKNRLVLSGQATTRFELSAFRDRLEESDRFKKVELPLSDLALDEDPPFTFTLTLK